MVAIITKDNIITKDYDYSLHYLLIQSPSCMYMFLFKELVYHLHCRQAVTRDGSNLFEGISTKVTDVCI